MAAIFGQPQGERSSSARRAALFASAAALAMGLTVGLAGPAHAQTPQTPPPASQTGETGTLGGASSTGTQEAPQSAPAAPNAGDAPAEGPIRDIIVTAQRRETLLQETPIAITAVTAETFEDLGASRLEDVARFVPGLFIPQATFGGAGGPSIRGIGSFNLVSSASFPVAFYYDGLFQDRPYGNNLRQFDLDRVEVLRGPQGVLFGRNATAGAIRIIYALPGDELAVRGNLSAGSFGTYEGQLSVRGPVADGVKLGVAGGLGTSRGWGRNRFNNQRVQGFDVENVRAAAVLDPADRFQLILRGQYAKEENTFGLKQIFADANGVVVTSDNQERGLNNSVLGINEFANNVPSFFEVTRYTGSAEATYKADSFDIIALLGHNQTDNISDSDTDGGDNVIFRRPVSINNHTENRYDAQSAELRFSSTNWTGFELDFGAFYINEFNDDRGTSLAFTSAAGVRLTDAISVISNTKTDAYAAFVNGRIDITDKLKGRAGVRYTFETKTTDAQLLNRITNTLQPRATATADFENITPAFGLDYEFSDLTFGYATISKGFKGGGFSTDPNTGQLFDYRQEEVWNYELGLKTDLFDRRLRLNSAVFYLDYTDLQLAQNLPNGGAVVNNAASARIYGAEFETIIRPVDQFTVSGSLAYLDAKYSDYLYISRPPTLNLGGERLERAPKWKGSIVAALTVPVGEGNVEFQGSYTYESEVAFQTVPDLPTAVTGPPASPPFERSRLYTRRAIQLVGARVEYTLPGDKISVSVLGDNLTDTRYFGALSRLGGGTSTVGTVNAPRSVRVELSLKY